MKIYSVSKFIQSMMDDKDYVKLTKFIGDIKELGKSNIKIIKKCSEVEELLARINRKEE